MTAASTALEDSVSAYRHEAFLYSGVAEFLTGTTSFIRRAVSAGDPVLVVVSRAKIALRRTELGADAEHVSFADMAGVGANPARIIAAWREFVQDHPDAAQLWGIGEPIDPERSPSELAECQLHEALLNVAFDVSVPFWLLCPYDLEALAAEVIEEAQRTHPYLSQGDDRQACSTFRPIDLAAPFARRRPSQPAGGSSMSFETGGLAGLRAFVAGQARQAGLATESVANTVLAVNEIATNSLQYGGGHGDVRVWRDGHSLVCEVSDQGHITAPLAGRLPPVLSGANGGLWLANQVCASSRSIRRPKVP